MPLWKRVLPWSGPEKRAVDSLAGTACVGMEAERYPGVGSDLTSPYLHHQFDHLGVCHMTFLYLIFPASAQGINILTPLYKRLCDLCVVITWATIYNFRKILSFWERKYTEFSPNALFSKRTCLNACSWHQMLDFTFFFLISVLSLFIGS